MRRKSTANRFVLLVAKYPYLLLIILFCAIASNVALLLTPRVIGKIIDLFDSGIFSGKEIIFQFSLLLVLYAFSCVLVWIMDICSNKISNNVTRDLRNQLFEKLGNVPIKYLDNKSKGELMSNFSYDIDAVFEGLNKGVTQLITGVFTIVLCIFFMFTLNVNIAIIVVILTPISFISGFIITKYGNKHFRRQSQFTGELSATTEEYLRALQTVKAFNYEDDAFEKFEKENDKLHEAGYKAHFASAMVNPSTRFVTNIAYVIVGIYGVFMMIAGTLSKGGVASFLTYTVQYSRPFNDISSVAVQLQQTIISATRLFVVLGAKDEIPDAEDALSLEKTDGDVEFKSVKFGYRYNRPLIKNLNLKVAKGQTVAVVGPTGAGKTTLVNLLMRFYELNDGEILIDGINICDITRDSLRKNIAMVLQDTWLFEGTIYDNIAYGNPSASHDEVLDAAKSAHAHSFIRKLPDGYDTAISSNGGNLSGGQKQLLTIARAMLLNSPLLILDEATSSVDILTEMRIQSVFQKMTKDKTTFIIAHRLSTIKHADVILVLNNGDIVEKGTHDELLSNNGFYYNLYHSQFATQI